MTYSRFLPQTILIACVFCQSVIFYSCSETKESVRTAVSTEAFHDGIHHWNLEHKIRNYKRLSENDELQIADNLIAWQNEDGGWPKNIDWLGILNIDSVRSTLKDKYKLSTLDNRNTYAQIDYLARVYSKNGGKKYKQSAIKGIEYLLSQQNYNGGWRGWDADAITFNDDVMTGVMSLFLDIVQDEDQYKWVKRSLRKKVKKAWKNGLDLILKCQIEQNGVKTAWAQQHDNTTFLPVMGRSFELPSITANESCPIIELLMRIEKPERSVIEAVENAVNWLEKSGIKGIKVEKIQIPDSLIINHEYPYDLIVVKDSTAKTIWARFYEIETNQPFMCTRAGEKVYSLADVDPERRTGYSWYGYWPENTLKKYKVWKNTLNENN